MFIPGGIPMRRFTYAIALLAALFLATSCSGGHSSSPVVPGLTGVSNRISDFSSSSRATWGVWDISINSITGAVEIIPMRGANFQVNAVNFMQPPKAPVQLLTLLIDFNQSNFPTGLVVCDVFIEHPFPATKFSGFDVMGIVMGDYPGYQLQSDPSAIVELPGEEILRNADGYTRWWNESEFTTYGTLFGYIDGAFAKTNWTSTHTLHPFKYFSDDLDPQDSFEPDVASRGYFSSAVPGVNARRYRLQFPVDSGPVFRYKYAVSASWVEPYPGSVPPLDEDDYPVTANMPEAYKISLLDNGSTAFYENESTYGGDLNLMIEVRDWQFDGIISNVMNEFGGITIESPILFPSPVELSIAGAELMPGNSTGIRVPATIENVTPDGVENQPLIITVRSANPTTYEPQIPGISGYDYPDADLAAYGIFAAPIASVGPQNVSPVADTSLTFPTVGNAPLDVDLDPSASFDPDGTIVLYEWDLETDGTWDITTVAPDIVPHIFESGIHVATLRVTDNDDATDTDEVTIQAGCVSDPGWTMLHQGLRRDGRGSVAGPVTDEIRYEWFAPDAIIGGIALDSNDRALFRCNDENVYCVDIDGNLVWQSLVGGTWDYCTPAIGPDDEVIVGSTNGSMWKFDSDGGVIWNVELGYGEIQGGISLLDDGSILFTTNTGWLAKLNEDGGVVWDYHSGATAPGGPAVGDNGTIYMSNHNGQVHAINQNGGVVWVANVTNWTMSASPALGEDGLYVGDWGGRFHKIDYNGGGVWGIPLASGGISGVAAIDCDGNVYIGSRDNNLYSVKAEDGSVNWVFSTCGEIGSNSPVLDSVGHIYCGAYCGHFYCLDKESGGLIWDKNLDIGSSLAMYCKSPAIASDGTIIGGSNAGKLFAFHDE
jgi:outer membrane protein assembly factor BamB